MEVLVGPTTTFSIEVSSPPPPPSSYAVTSSQATACIFLKEEDESADQSLISNGPDYSSDSSSSIGAPDDSGDEEEVNSVISSKGGGGGGGGGGLGSLDSLEDSLPVKRGLSNHFSGKSKSFANLADTITVNRVKDLEKPENPFNKRRRLLMANKLCRKKSSFYTWRNPKSMPLLALNEHEEEEEEERGEDDEDNNGRRYNQNDDGASPASSSPEQNHHQLPKLSSKLQERKFRTSLKFHSCFSLADLQHQEEDEEYQ